MLAAAVATQIGLHANKRRTLCPVHANEDALRSCCIGSSGRTLLRQLQLRSRWVFFPNRPKRRARAAASHEYAAPCAPAASEPHATHTPVPFSKGRAGQHNQAGTSGTPRPHNQPHQEWTQQTGACHVVAGIHHLQHSAQLLFFSLLPLVMQVHAWQLRPSTAQRPQRTCQLHAQRTNHQPQTIGPTSR